MDQNQRLLLMRCMGAFAAVLVVMLVVGTFADYQIAQAIYTPGNLIFIFISSLAFIPMAYPTSFLMGVLAQRSLVSKKSQVLRIAGAVLCFVAAMLVGALVTKSLFSVRNGLGGMFGSELPLPASMGIGVVVGGGLCALGMGAGKANDAEDLARRVLVVVVVLLVSFVAVEILKSFMSRPRPYALFAGYDGVEFSPWYSKSSGTNELMAAYGLDKDAFKSFPSGQSLQAAALLTAFYGLSLVYPGLRQKLGVVLVVEIVFTLTVMASRMVLGAHFLSDVSVGALVSVIGFLVLLALQERQPRQP